MKNPVSTKGGHHYALDAIQSPHLSLLYEPVYSDSGDPLFVMDQISDKKNLEKTGWRFISLNETMKRAFPNGNAIIDMRFFEEKNPD